MPSNSNKPTKRTFRILYLDLTSFKQELNYFCFFKMIPQCGSMLSSKFLWLNFFVTLISLGFGRFIVRGGRAAPGTRGRVSSGPGGGTT